MAWRMSTWTRATASFTAEWAKSTVSHIQQHHEVIANLDTVLRLKEVEFTAEFYTVLEHGRQANLSLVRFKQERGAASSFNKVVDTVHMILKSREMIVEEPVRAKKMSRVLDTIPNAS